MPLEIPVSPAALESIAAEHGTPYQLYDEASMRANVRSLIDTFSAAFPGFRQFFAVKALPNPAILRLLIDEGCGLDCSSVSELFIAKKLGVKGSDVMYTSNYTAADDLGFAFDMGAIMNLDDASLVASVVEARGRCPELISFRLNPGLGRTDSETKSNVLGGPDAKFGVPPDQIVGAYVLTTKYRAAKEAGATRFGIHMMTGSCVMKSTYWEETVASMFDTLNAISTELGIEFEFVNVGGGLGIPYKPDEAVLDVADVCRRMRAVVDAKCAEHGIKTEPKLMMENGRYITGPFGWLVTRCKAMKTSFGQEYYGVDACMSNLMRPGMYDSYHHITIPGREGGMSILERAAAQEEGEGRAPRHVVGTLCENNDWFCKGRDLPTAQLGDLVVIHDTGAHAHSMGFQYNGKLRAPELLVRSGGQETVALIRERETIESLYANCVMPEDLAPAADAAEGKA